MPAENVRANIQYPKVDAETEPPDDYKPNKNLVSYSYHPALIMTTRSKPAPWRHDAYTLRRLVAAVQQCILRAKAQGALGEGRTVVDLGCGDKPYEAMFTDAGARYVSCDIEAGAGVDQTIGSDGRTSLPDGVADCVASFQVLEHVWDLDAYLQECRRLLARDGLLILSTHGNWLYHPHPADFRRWTHDGLVRELESRGFEVIESWPLVGPLAWTTQFRTLAYHHVLKRLGPIGRLLSGLLCLFMHGRMLLEDRVTPAPLIRTNAAIYLLLARVAGREQELG